MKVVIRATVDFEIETYDEEAKTEAEAIEFWLANKDLLKAHTPTRIVRIKDVRRLAGLSCGECEKKEADGKGMTREEYLAWCQRTDDKYVEELYPYAKGGFPYA